MPMCTINMYSSKDYNFEGRNVIVYVYFILYYIYYFSHNNNKKYKQ